MCLLLVVVGDKLMPIDKISWYNGHNVGPGKEFELNTVSYRGLELEVQSWKTQLKDQRRFLGEC